MGFAERAPNTEAALKSLCTKRVIPSVDSTGCHLLLVPFCSSAANGQAAKEDTMSTILLVILILLLIGALPHWPYSSGWGYYPSGGLGLLVLILIILLLTGRL